MPKPASDLALKALIDWWSDMGVVADPAMMRALAKAKGKASAPAKPAEDAPVPTRRKRAQPLEARIKTAQDAAANAGDFAALVDAITAFDGCPLKANCENTVIFDGVAGAPVMVLGEGPGGQEDKHGKPFIGPAGQLLDRMLAAINLSRANNTLISNVNYWRPPSNRNPEPDELAVCRPFVDRMIELAKPKLLITAGAVPSQTLLATKTGIMRLRGSEKAYTTPGGYTVPVFPILHPAFLLRRPQEKSRAWRDLQAIERRLGEL